MSTSEKPEKMIHGIASPGKFQVVTEWPLDDNEESIEGEKNSLEEAIAFANGFVEQNPCTNVTIYNDRGMCVHMAGTF